MQDGFPHISLGIGRDAKGSPITGELNALGFGFSLFQVWLYMAIFGVATVFDGVSLHGDAATGMYLPAPLANNILYSFLGVSAVVLILLGITNQRYLRFYVSKTVIWFAAAFCCTGTLAVFGACVGAQADTISWLQIFSSLLAGTLMGIGSSFLIVLWGTEFSRCDFPTIVLNAAFSMAVGLVIAFLLTIWVPSPACGIVTAILPACAVLFLWKLTPVPFYERIGTPGDPDAQEDMTDATGKDGRGTEPVFKPLSHDLRTRMSFLFRIFTPTLVLGITLGALRMACVGEILPSGNITIQLTLGAACGTSLVIFIIAIALSNRRLYWDTLFRCLTPLVAIGAAFLPFLNGDSAVVSTFFITLGFISLEVLFWVFFADISQKFRISPIFIFGIGRGVLEISAIVGSFLASTILHGLPTIAASTDTPLGVASQNGDLTLPFALTLLLVCSVSVGYALLPRLREIAGVVAGSKMRTKAVREAIETEENIEENVLESAGKHALSNGDSIGDEEKEREGTSKEPRDGRHSAEVAADSPKHSAGSSPNTAGSAASAGNTPARKIPSSISWGSGTFSGAGLGFNASIMDAGSGLNLGAIPGAGLSAGVAAGMAATGIEKTPQQTRAEKGSFKRRCDEISKTYVLSRREQEVLVLLAKGHNASFIQDKLCVSRSTAKTHINHIYKKLNIHTQQELLNMVEERQHGVK